MVELEVVLEDVDDVLLELPVPVDALSALNDMPGATFVVDVDVVPLGFAIEDELPPICSRKELSADGSSRIASTGDGVTLLTGLSDDPAVVAVVVSGVVVGVVVVGEDELELSFGSVVVWAMAGTAETQVTRMISVPSLDI